MSIVSELLFQLKKWANILIQFFHASNRTGEYRHVDDIGDLLHLGLGVIMIRSGSLQTRRSFALSYSDGFHI